jgi:hypothetical protein
MIVEKRGLWCPFVFLIFTPIGSQTIWRPGYSLIFKEILLYNSLLFSKKNRVLKGLSERIRQLVIFCFWLFTEGGWSPKIELHIERLRRCSWKSTSRNNRERAKLLADLLCYVLIFCCRIPLCLEKPKK